SEDDFDFAGHSALESIDPNRDTFLHVLESLRIKISYAQKFVFVLDVVVQQKSEIGIVVDPMLRHQIQYVIRKPIAVLDRGATGKTCLSSSFGTLSVNDSPLPQCSCLAASSIDLGLCKDWSATFTDTFRREDFDQICSLGRNLSDKLPNLIRIAGGFI